jgi:hypothetical protein
LRVSAPIEIGRNENVSGVAPGSAEYTPAGVVSAALSRNDCVAARKPGSPGLSLS